jgi:hypothetical protein
MRAAAWNGNADNDGGMQAVNPLVTPDEPQLQRVPSAKTDASFWLDAMRDGVSALVCAAVDRRMAEAAQGEVPVSRVQDVGLPVHTVSARCALAMV